MRIAVWHNLPSGGGKRALYDQVRGLLAQGHVVESWCPPTADQTYLPLGEIVREQIVPLPRYRRLTLGRITRVPRDVRRGLLEMEDHCRAVATSIRRGGFDVLLAHSCLMFRTTPIARFVDTPTVLYQHEPYRWFYEALPRLPWLPSIRAKRHALDPRRIQDAMFRRRQLHNVRHQALAELDNATAFDKILVNSLFSRESILRAYGLDAEVCYLGIDLAHFTKQDRAREPFVVGLGSITREKNVELALRAIATLPEPRPPLVWIGNISDAGYTTALSEMADSLGVVFEPRVRLPDAEVIEQLNRASVMVYAPRLEPFGLAPLEAAACGLPVVGVAEGGVRETVIDGITGLLVSPTPHAVATAISTIIDDPQLGRKLGDAARVNAERRWSASVAADRLEQVLLGMLSQRADRPAP